MKIKLEFFLLFIEKFQNNFLLIILFNAFIIQFIQENYLVLIFKTFFQKNKTEKILNSSFLFSIKLKPLRNLS